MGDLRHTWPVNGRESGQEQAPSDVAQHPNARWRSRWVLVLVPVLALLIAAAAAITLVPERFGLPGHLMAGDSATVDSDGDGLLDEIEEAGWGSSDGSEYRTDPDLADSDGDGLTDGDEAGPSLEVVDGRTTYAGWSDPNKPDTDDDGLTDAVETGDPRARPAVRQLPYVVSDPRIEDSDDDSIGDGDEYFLDMDPLSSDTDADGLGDLQELEFGSDPTLGNADEDSYTDEEEFERGSNPLSYDLTSDEKIEASAAGLKYGDCDECALDAGLRVEQIESVEYLAGHFVSGVAVYGDFRDVALDIWKQQFLSAGIAALGLLPFVGDGSKAVSLLTKFARRGDRAEEAVRAVTDKLPLSDSIKQKILAGLPSRVGRLPIELVGGPRIYMVYKAKDYIGITSDFARRQAQHARAGRTFMPQPMQGATGLSRGEARAIEQACIVQGGLLTSGGALQNRRNSISPSLPYYDAAVTAGRALLEKFGATCPMASGS